jgi:hypothetical protein
LSAVGFVSLHGQSDGSLAVLNFRQPTSTAVYLGILYVLQL